MAIKRATTVQARISGEGLAKIDQLRGSWTRSDFIRHALALAIKQGVKGPDKRADGL